jgi:hypothetical protein
MAFAAGEEITQQFFPNRTFDWVDLLADFCGIAFFSLLQQGWRCRRSGDSFGKMIK